MLFSHSTEPEARTPKHRAICGVAPTPGTLTRATRQTAGWAREQGVPAAVLNPLSNSVPTRLSGGAAAPSPRANAGNGRHTAPPRCSIENSPEAPWWQTEGSAELCRSLCPSLCQSLSRKAGRPGDLCTRHRLERTHQCPPMPCTLSPVVCIASPFWQPAPWWCRR
jgi:hypothetical protein